MVNKTKESVRERLHSAVLDAIRQQPNRSYGDIAKDFGYSVSFVTRIAKCNGLKRCPGRPTTVTDQTLVDALTNHPEVTYAQFTKFYKVSTNRLSRLAKENGIIRFCGRRLGSGKANETKAEQIFPELQQVGEATRLAGHYEMV